MDPIQSGDDIKVVFVAFEYVIMIRSHLWSIRFCMFIHEKTDKLSAYTCVTAQKDRLDDVVQFC